MPRIDRHPRRGLGHETPGSVDYPFDRDTPSSQATIPSDAACSIAWRADGFEAVQVFVDPALRDRAEEVCQTVEGICGQHRDVDSLSAAIISYADRNHLSASVHERPPADLSADILAVAFTLG